MNTVTYKEVEYDICIEGKDICLQSIHQDIIIEGGYEDLKNECIEEVRFPICADGESMEWEWDGDTVDNMVNDRLAEYAADHASEGSVLNHNVN